MAPRLTPAQIAQRARAYGLDPQAVLAVASREGLSGGIGDGGHAYGPFQLNNAGGVITGSHPGVNDQATQEWAWSPEGVNYALSRMGAARGQTGRRAINSIVTQFERPANPQAEIAGALGAYGSQGGAGAGGPSSFPAPAAAVGPQLVPQQPQVNLQAALSRASTGGDYTGFYQQLGQSRRAQAQPPVQGQGQPQVAGQLAGDTTLKGVGGIAKTALTQLGTPYQWGGKAALGSRTDCSGLLQASARANGVALGRTTYQQFKQGAPVPLDKLQPGDAVFSEQTAQGPGHVAIYIGGGRVVEDPHTGASVRISTLAGRRGIVGARRYG